MVLTRFFDVRHTLLRLSLLSVSGIGYLALLRDPGDHMTPADWTLAGLAVLLPPLGVRWPFATALAQTVVLIATHVIGSAEPVVPSVGASWAVLELALRAPGRPLWTVITLLCGAYLLGDRDELPGQAVGVLFNLVIVVGVPVLLGVNIRTSRRLAREAEERATTEARRRVSESRAARADERTAIARELHDVVAHHIASIVLRVGVARHVLQDPEPRFRAVLDDVHATGSAALADLRQLVSVLRDPQLAGPDPIVVAIEPGSLPAALGAAVDRARQGGISVEADVDPALSTVDSVRGLAVLRLTQEGLTNVARHAGRSAKVRLSIAVTDDTLRWSLTDDGGADDAPAAVVVPGGGHGITGMRERVEVLGGRLEAGPAVSGRGWRLRAALPARIGQPS
jgi:signal transduction histidine kinase